MVVATAVVTASALLWFYILVTVRSVASLSNTLRKASEDLHPLASEIRYGFESARRRLRVISNRP